jgi:hypothetical protein
LTSIERDLSGLRSLRLETRGRFIVFETLLAVEQPNKVEGRPDSQDVKKITEYRADGKNKAKTYGECCRTNEANYRNPRAPKTACTSVQPSLPIVAISMTLPSA